MIDRRRSTGVRVGEVCGARDRPAAQSWLSVSVSARALHLRTQRLVRPNAVATSSALSPAWRRRTACLRSSSSDTPAPRSHRTSQPTRRNDVLRSTDLHHRNDVLRPIHLVKRNDVLRFAPERCPADRHLTTLRPRAAASCENAAPNPMDAPAMNAHGRYLCSNSNVAFRDRSHDPSDPGPHSI